MFWDGVFRDDIFARHGSWQTGLTGIYYRQNTPLRFGCVRSSGQFTALASIPFGNVLNALLCYVSESWEAFGPMAAQLQVVFLGAPHAVQNQCIIP